MAPINDYKMRLLILWYEENHSTQKLVSVYMYCHLMSINRNIVIKVVSERQINLHYSSIDEFIVRILDRWFKMFVYGYIPIER